MKKNNDTRLIVFAALACMLFFSKTALSGEEAAAEVGTAKVINGEIPQTIESYGVVQPDAALVQNVSMPGDGIVSEVFVRTGQLVQKGDNLVRLHSSPTLQAAYTQAIASQDYAKNNYRRMQELFSEKMATRDQVDQAERDMVATQAELKRLKKTGAADGEGLVLTAPMEGVITAVNAVPGDHLQADTILVSVADRNAQIVKMGVEPSDVSRLSIGDAVQLTAPQNGNIDVQGKIRSVSGMVSPDTHLVDAVAEIPHPENVKGLIFGMTLRGTIVLDTWKGKVIPRSALLQDENGTYTFTISGGHAHRVAVEIQAEKSDILGVSSPELHVGDIVAVSDNSILDDNMPVKELADHTTNDTAGDSR